MSVHKDIKRITTNTLQEMKLRGEKIAATHSSRTEVEGQPAYVLTFLSGSIGTLMRSISISFSPIDQMTEFSRGLYDTRPIIWYFVMTGLALFLTLQSFQSRRWR